MSRIQLALRVSDLDAAIGFYSTLFGTGPAKVRPGYANFAIADPPLKLVLIEKLGDDGVRLDHLGVEVSDPAAVVSAAAGLAAAGLMTREQSATTCCYAVQDKVWVHDPDGAPWEVYTVLADVPEVADATAGPGSASGDPGCCPAPASSFSGDLAVTGAAACC